MNRVYTYKLQTEGNATKKELEAPLETRLRSTTDACAQASSIQDVDRRRPDSSNRVHDAVRADTQFMQSETSDIAGRPGF
jgi:hypothetical protein